MKIVDLLKSKNLSKKDQITLGLLIFAFGVLIVILVSNDKNTHNSAPDEQISRQEVVLNKQANQADEEKARKLKPVEVETLLQGVGRNDPFSQATRERSSARAELNLVGIMWDAKKPLAVINDTIVAQGDMIRDKKVIKIEKGSVVLKENGKEQILKLREIDLP